MRAPIFIAQGRHDTRTPARQLTVDERRMQELGNWIEVYWIDASLLLLEAGNLT